MLAHPGRTFSPLRLTGGSGRRRCNVSPRASSIEHRTDDLRNSTYGQSSSGRSNALNSFEDLWSSIDSHLFAAYNTLQTADEGILRSLKAPKHRMRWYTVIYNACSGDPSKSRELYARLALLLLHILESHILFPILHCVDPERVHYITGEDGEEYSSSVLSGAKAEASGSGRRLGFLRRFFGPRRGAEEEVEDSTAGKSDTLHNAGCSGTSGPSTPLLRMFLPKSMVSSSVPNQAEEIMPIVALDSTILISNDGEQSQNTGKEVPPSWFPEVPLSPLSTQPAASAPPLHSSSFSTPQTSFVSAVEPVVVPAHYRIASATGRVMIGEEDEILCNENTVSPLSRSMHTIPSNSMHNADGDESTPHSAELASSIAVAGDSNVAAEAVASTNAITTTEAATVDTFQSPHERSVTAAPVVTSSARGRSDGHRHSSPDRHHFSLCLTFIEEWKTFVSFHKVVLTCFRYLDQYYTRRFGMDTIALMCFKVFYVVVYEPLRPLLIQELRLLAQDVRDIYERTGLVAMEQVEVIQQTYNTMIDLLVLVSSTSSRMVAQQRKHGSGGGGAVTAAPGTGAATLVTPAFFPTSLTSQPVGDSARSRASSRARSIGGMNSGRSSAVSTPILKAVADNHSISTPSRGDGGSGGAPGQPLTSKRRLFFSFISGGRIGDAGGRLSSATAKQKDGVPLKSAVSSAPASPGPLVSTTSSFTGVVNDSGSLERDAKPAASPAAASAQMDGAEVDLAATTNDLMVVDLRGVVDLRDRLEGHTSSAQALTTQAMKQWEAMAADRRVQVGTIIKASVDTPPTVVMEDLVNVYIDDAVKYYTHTRELHLASAPADKKDYVQWATGAMHMEEQFWGSVQPAFIHVAISSTLRNVLVVEPHRQLLQHGTWGLRALLDSWSTEEDNGAASSVSQYSLYCSSITTRTSADESAYKKAKAVPAAKVTKVPPSTRWQLSLLYELFTDVTVDECFVLMASILVTKMISEASQCLLVYFDAVRALGTTSDTTQAPTTSQLQLGDELISALLNLWARYSDLVDGVFHGHRILHSALQDGMEVVLSPSRWTQHGAMEAAHQRARGTLWAAGDTALPSVLLSRDARRATDPLVSLTAVYPKSKQLSMASLLAQHADLCLLRDRHSASVSPTLSLRIAHISLFASMLSTKDAFLEMHRHCLARRLLGISSSSSGVGNRASKEAATSPVSIHGVDNAGNGHVNTAAERQLVCRLQKHLGAASVYAFEVMLRDYDGTLRTGARFQETPAFRGLATKVAVQLMTTTSWPTYSSIPLRLPLSLQQGIDAFQTYYSTHHRSRSLKWMHSLGTVTLAVDLPNGSKEVVANTILATILLGLSDAVSTAKGGLTGAELVDHVGASFDQLRPHLHLLTQHRQYAMVVQRGPSQSHHPAATPVVEDIFSLNPSFGHKLHRLRLPMPRTRPSMTSHHSLDGGGGAVGTMPMVATHPTGRGSSGSDAGAVEDARMSRRLMIDVAIVQALKSRGSMAYEELVQLVASKVSLSLPLPRDRDVKARLGDLIDREYVERSRTESDVFRFVP